MNPIRILQRGGAATRLLALAYGVAGAALMMGLGVTQEVPIGGVSGRLTMRENGKPLDKVKVVLTPVGPEDEYVRARGVLTAPDGTYRFDSIPAGTYEVDATAKFHAMKRKFVRVEEGNREVADLRLEPSEPSLRLYASQRVFTPEEKPKLEMHGFGKEEKVSLSVRELNLDAIVSNGGPREALRPLVYPDSDSKVNQAIFGERVVLEDREIAARDAEGAFIEDLNLPSLKEGFYWVSVKHGKRSAGVFVNVTKIALVTKSGDGQVLAFVTDLASGKPVPSAEILLARSSRMEVAGKTEADGKTQVPAAGGDGMELVLARHGDSLALTGFYSGGSRAEARPTVGWLTDRPVYRPGDRVQFKGTIRVPSGLEFKLPKVDTLPVEILDNREQVIRKESLTINEHGSFFGEFSTSREAEPGIYTVRAKIGIFPYDHSVELAAYRKPEFTVDLRPEKETLIAGETARIVIDCKYYFGSPVPGAKIRGYSYRNPRWGEPDFDGSSEGSYERFSFSGGEYSESFEAVTDDAGRATIEVPTRVADDPEEYPTDFDYTFNVTVQGPGDKAVDKEVVLTVCRGSFALSPKIDRSWMRPNESSKVQVRLRDHLTGKPVANQDVTMEAGIDVYERRSSAFISRKVMTATTDATGIATFSFLPDTAGDWRLKFASRDSEKRWVRREQSIWVDGDVPRAPMDARLKVLVDRPEYKPGDTIEALVQTSAPGGFALVTVETDQVFVSQVVELKQATTRVNLPVERRYAPNAFVTATYIYKKKFASAEQQIKVGAPDRGLTIKVDVPESASPGQTVPVSVLATDSEGKPVQGEVALGIVDESIYAIREDSTNLNEQFYPERYHGVDTNYSFPEVFLDGGDKGGNVPLRSRFEDTAAWLPTLVTGPDGKASVDIKLPDNLGEWRATATMVSDKTAIGRATASFKARKDLMVRISTPQYMVQGDSQEITAVVTNDSTAEQDVDLKLEVSGAELAGDASSQLRLAPGATKSLPVQMQVADPGTVTLVATATGKSLAGAAVSDGVKQTLEVQPYAELEVVSKGGRVRDGFEFGFDVSREAVAGKSELKVALSPGLLAALEGSLEALIDFPYGCTEQTMSRFMPAVVVSRLLADQGISRPELTAKIPAVVADGYARLATLQHGDGGWGWWAHDESEPLLTALVLDGLSRSNAAGEPIRAVRLADALTWAKSRLEKPIKEDRPADLFYLAYGLAQYPEGIETAKKRVGKISDRKLTPAGLALASLAYGSVGDSAKQKRALDRLVKLVQIDKSGARWEAAEGWYMDEANALALNALVAARPNDPLVDLVAQNLMFKRRATGWATTRTTSYTLLGISAHLRNLRGELAAGTVQVYLDGTPVKSVVFEPGDAAEVTVRLGAEQLAAGRHKLQVRGAGQGKISGAWVAAELRQYVKRDPIPPVTTEPDFTITREFKPMVVRKDEDGNQQLVPAKKGVSEVTSGDSVACVVTVKSKVDREYVLVEVPLPSNVRALDLGSIDAESWSYWWSDTVVRDDRVAFFARQLSKGENVFQIMVRAESPGKSRALPARVANMYDEAKYATSGETPLAVRR